MKHFVAAAAVAMLAWTALPLSASAAATTPVERSARSKECSTQADAKGLHGKARKRFRSACKRGAA